MVTYYELLGVKRQATFEQIRKAYRLNVAAYHPDINDAPNAQGLTILLNAAWETLSEPDLREKYDELLMTVAPAIEKSNDEAAKARRTSEPAGPQSGTSAHHSGPSEQKTTAGPTEPDRSPGETIAVTVLGGTILPFEIIVEVRLPASETQTYPDGPYRIAMYQDGRYVVVDGRPRIIANFARSVAIFFRACKMSGLTTYQRGRLAAGRPAVLPNA